ncbi:MAG TPA: cytochrome c [Phycisphaerae bacterium]|jgi:mono/diheme cytochrome c family protein|nr:cytochrome c [Phycisphaerae bacterium]
MRLEKYKNQILLPPHLHCCSSWPFVFLVFFVLNVVGCKRQDMADQARFKPFAPSSFYPDGASARLPVPHTVSRSTPDINLDEGQLWQTALPLTTPAPFPITPADLRRGQQVFTIYCTPCHGQLGDGNGMIPQRGFLHPPTYHSDRLRNAPDAYFYNVITNGIGAMYPYADRVAPDDRWRVVAYIRALQLSQYAPPQDAPGAAPTATAPATGNGRGATP